MRNYFPPFSDGYVAACGSLRDVTVLGQYKSGRVSPTYWQLRNGFAAASRS